MIATDFSENIEDLDRQLTSRGDDEGTEPVEFGPLSTVEFFEDGN